MRKTQGTNKEENVKEKIFSDDGKERESSVIYRFPAGSQTCRVNADLRDWVTEHVTP